MSQYTIEHHGILGQRWGIRRYQNKDGTLTPLGKQRQALADAKQEYKIRRKDPNSDKESAKADYKTKTGKIKQKISAEKEKEDARNEEERKRQEAEKLQAEKERIIKSGNADLVMKNRDKLTTQELQQAAARIEIESRISNYTSLSKKEPVQNKSEKQNVGRKFINFINNRDKDVKTLGASYNTMANIANTIIGEDKFRTIYGMAGYKKKKDDG